MYKKAVKGWLKHLDYLVLDVLCMLVSMLLAVHWADGRLLLEEGRMVREFLFIAIFLDVFIKIMIGSDMEVQKRGYAKAFAVTLRHSMVFVVLLSIAPILSGGSSYLSWRSSLLMFFLYQGSSYFVRLSWRYVLVNNRGKNQARLAVLIITNTASAPEILSRMEKYSIERYRVSGLVLTDKDMEGSYINGVPVVANLSNAASYLCREWTDEVFFFRVSLEPRCQDLIERCREMALTTHLFIALQGVGEDKQTVESLGGYEVLTSNINLMSPMDAFLKRSFDLVCGLFGSMVAGLLILVLGPIIKLQSPGPILFKQKRVGENGHPITIYKIRSMYMDAEARKAEYAAMNDHSDGMLFKMEFDPRVIGNRVLPDGSKRRGIGAFIRRTSLDEFPQFFNVLKGEMSVVGTRPPTLDEWEKYQFHHRARMSTKPGLTGLWQINKDKDTMDFDQVVKLDTEYITSWSLGLDLRIIYETALYVVRELLARGKKSSSKGKAVSKEAYTQ